MRTTHTNIPSDAWAIGSVTRVNGDGSVDLEYDVPQSPERSHAIGSDNPPFERRVDPARVRSLERPQWSGARRGRRGIVQVRLSRQIPGARG